MSDHKASSAQCLYDLTLVSEFLTVSESAGYHQYRSCLYIRIVKRSRVCVAREILGCADVDHSLDKSSSRLEYSRYTDNFWHAHAPLQDLRVDTSCPVIRCPMPSYQSYRGCTGLVRAFSRAAPAGARSIVGPLSLVGCNPLVNTHILMYHTCL